MLIKNTWSIAFISGFLLIIFYVLGVKTISKLAQHDEVFQSDIAVKQLSFLNDLSRININSESDLEKIKDAYEIAPLLSKYTNKSKLTNIEDWKCKLTKIQKISDHKFECECQYPIQRSKVLFYFTITSIPEIPQFSVGKEIKLSGKIAFLYVHPAKGVSAVFEISQPTFKNWNFE